MKNHWMTSDLAGMDALRLLLFALAAILLPACGDRTQSQPSQSVFSDRPAEVVGIWKSAPAGEDNPQGLDVQLVLPAEGLGQFLWRVNDLPADSAQGLWVKVGDFLIVDRQETGGFAAFRVVSSTPTAMVIANRTGARLRLIRTE